MNTSDNKPNKWTEADVDHLLTGFFAQEMPAEFRLPSQSINRAQVDRAQPVKSGRMVWAGMAATAAALMFAVIVTRSTVPDSSPGDSIANTDLVPTDPKVPVTDRIETEEGTVQMKTWLIKEQDADPGLDLRSFPGLEFEFEFESDEDEDDSDSARKPSTDSPAVPEED